MKRFAIVLCLIVVGSAITFYAHSEYVRVEAAPERISHDFAVLNAAQERDIADTREKNVVP
jgi:hypothetical protein